MRERGFAEMLILYGIVAVVTIGAIGMTVYKINHWCNAACVVVTEERDLLAKQKAAALKREAAIALLWSAQVDKTGKAEAQLEALRNERFAPVRVKVAALPAADRGVRVPAAVVGVLNDAAIAANTAGSTAGITKAAPPAADSALGVVADWAVVVTEIHAECRDRVAQWETFYSGLRAAQQGVP